MKFALLLFAAMIPAWGQGCEADSFGRLVRVEGKAELVGDVVVTCFGGASTAPGSPIPAADITLTFNAPVASRVLTAPNVSEALLLLDEPQPGSQFACLPGPCLANAPVGIPYYGSNSVRNVYQGVIASPTSIKWSSVPFDGAEARTFRFTNIRLDATAAQSLQLTGITATVVRGQLPWDMTTTPAVTVGFSQGSLSAAVRDSGNQNDAPAGVPIALAQSGAAAARVATLRYFSTPNPRTDAPLTSLDAAPPPVSQDVPGNNYNSESGFYAPTLGFGNAGLADTGTRLRATFTNIPAGVTVYVNLRNDNAVLVNGLAGRLVSTDANGAGAFNAVAGNGTYAPLTAVNGAATAVWEVINPFADVSGFYDFGVYLSYNPNIFVAPPAINVSVGYAPSVSTSIPNFTGSTQPQPLATFTATPPTISVSPQSLSFTGTVGGNNPATQNLTIDSAPSALGYSLTGGGKLAFVFAPSNTGTTRGATSVMVNIAGMSAGVTNDSITVSIPPVSTQVPVTLTLAAAPTISSISPSTQVAGSPGFVLSVNGANFTATTTVRWNGTALATTFVNSGQLTATVPAALIARSGQPTVTAVTADGSVSNGLPFAITIPPFTCSADVRQPAQMRSEGHTELAGDVTVACAGGESVLQGQPVPRANLTLTFNANVTSRLSEALLLVDEPQPGAQNSGNVLPGVVSGNSITWANAPVDQPGLNATRTFRFTNIRLDAAASGASDLVLTGLTGLPAKAGVTVGTAQASLTTTVRDAANAVAAAAGVPVALNTAGSAATRVATLRFGTQFQRAAVTRTVAPASSLDAAPAPAAQDIPGGFYAAESRFYSPTAAPAGLADWGTRLMATFSNLPPNVTVYVSLRNDGAAVNGTIARLVITDASGAGPFSSPGGNGSIAQLTPTAGVATAVWEVLSNVSELPSNFDFGVYVSYGSGIYPAPPGIDVKLGYAPAGGTQAPRFNASSQSLALASFTAMPPPVPTITVAPSSLIFRGTANGPNPPAQGLTIGTNPVGLGYGLSGGGTLFFRFQPPSGTTVATSAVSIDIRGLTGGTYTDVINVASAGASMQVPVTLVLAPAPVIVSLNPASAPAGSPGFNMTVTGANFVPGTTAMWNGAPLATTFGNATQLTAALPAALLTTAGKASITAVTPDGSVSNAASFTITAFALTSIAPNTVGAAGPDFPLTATGTGFDPAATLNVGGTALKPTSVSATSLMATVPAALIAKPGTLAVTVANPGSVTSNALTLTVKEGPVLTSIAPDTVTATGPAFTLTLTGTGFAEGAKAQIGGTSLTPGSATPKQISVTVPADLIAQPGTLPVRVVNPDGAQSNAANLTVNPAPHISALSPSSTTAGAPGFTLTVTGTNLTGTTVRWNGQSLTTAGGGTQLTAQVPAALVATAGTATVNAATGDGVISNALTFTVTPGMSITALDPVSATAGSGAFALTVTGVNLPAGAQVNWNGQGVPTTSGTPTQVTAQVPASLVAAPGTASVTLTAPDGATSNALTFRIGLPTLTNVNLGAPGSAGSGVDQTVTVGLPGNLPVDLVGKLTLTFTPDGGLPDDPTIQFQNGSRAMTFTIPAATTPAPPTVLVKTGTVAGTITITLTFTTPSGTDVTPAGLAPQQIQVGRAAPVITSLTCTRSGSGFTATADGYTNTREATQATFDFASASGASLGTTQLVVPAGQMFVAWFGSAGSAGAGGLFRYTQPFTIQGTGSTVTGVTLRLANAVGASAPATCQLQ